MLLRGGGMRQIALLLGGALLVGLGCKSTPSGNGSGCKSTVAIQTIEAGDNLTFTPTTPTVSRGQSVCWENLGTAFHTVTALVTVSNGTTVDTLWNIDAQLNPDLVVLASFGTTGNYTYHCRLHSGMTGTIQVR
jgi:plastocyanin